jgi:hypothetical protein
MLHTISQLPEHRREEARQFAPWLDKVHKEWLSAVIELDDQSSIAENLEHYLTPPSIEQRRYMEDQDYKRFYSITMSREEFDKMRSGIEAAEKEKRLVFRVIQIAYRDEALADAIWDFIQALKTDHAI